MADIAQLEQEILGAVGAASDEAALEAVRVASLGKTGSVSALLKTLGTMSAEERKTQGPAINGLKDRVSESIAQRKDALGAATLDARLNTEIVDVTLPVREAQAETGRIHPISQVTDELTAIFADMGFAIAEGPDVETDDYNVTKLNFPEGHPARGVEVGLELAAEDRDSEVELPLSQVLSAPGIGRCLPQLELRFRGGNAEDPAVLPEKREGLLLGAGRRA